jgi:hypothetical protein
MFKIKDEEIVNDLLKILELISDINFWTQDSIAKDENDNRLYDPYDKNAKKYCLLGACYFLEIKEKTKQYIQEKSNDLGYYDMTSLNDQNNHKFVITFIINLLKK